MSFNKIILIGNLGKDPELRYSPQGTAIANFSLATNEKKKDREGNFKNVPTWFKVTLWRNQAENAAKYLTKGSAVYIEGTLGVEEWTDRDGNKRFTFTVNAKEMQFLPSGGERSGPRDDEASGPGFDNTSSGFTHPAANDSDIPF